VESTIAAPLAANDKRNNSQHLNKIRQIYNSDKMKLPIFGRSSQERMDKPAKSRTYKILFRKWPRPARLATWWLLLLELLGVVPALVIFGISQPDLYRSDMWRIGWEHDPPLNSNPAMILYAYANHRPLPKVALVWTRT
jgi:hypothetical protein